MPAEPLYSSLMPQESYPMQRQPRVQKGRNGRGNIAIGKSETSHSTNSKKIMNESLNMISKSRNKYLNKSCNTGSNSSGRPRLIKAGIQTNGGSSNAESIKLGSTSTFNQMFL